MARSAAAERATRLLRLLPLLRRDARVDLSQVAGSLGADPAQLADDLVTLSMCGVPPYSPDALVAAHIEGGEVVAWSDPPALSGPVRLTPAEAAALHAALEAAGVGDDEMIDALLAAAGPASGMDEALRTRIVSPKLDLLGVLARAVEERTPLAVTYLASSTSELSGRVVHPYSLDDHEGAWYLTAHCEKAGAVRVFRVDRIKEVQAQAGTFDAPLITPRFDPTPFAGDDLPVAVIEFADGETVEPEEFPGATVEVLEDGRVSLTVPYVKDGWIARTVVSRLGAARVVSPASLQESVSDLANTLLEEI